MPIYACVDNQDLIEISPDDEIPGQNEISHNGQSYRRLDSVFLAWIESCVNNVVSNTQVDSNYVGELIDFLERCNATGVKPCDSKTIPKGYRKPDIAQQLDWVGEIEWGHVTHTSYYQRVSKIRGRNR